ncbi:unnamed protein product [Closterium sp. NIES-54]
MYRLHFRGNYILLTAYVDDLLYPDTSNELLMQFEKNLSKRVKITSTDHVTQFLGLNISYAPAPGPVPSPSPAPYLAPRPAPFRAQRPSPYLPSARPRTCPAPGPAPRPPPLGPPAPCLAPRPPGSSAPTALLQDLPFDPEGRPVAFDTWHDDLQLYLLSDCRDSVSLFDLVSSAAPTPLATADVSTRSQWLSHDATARLAIRNHLPATECAHFGEQRTAQTLYDALVARYSSPATTALGRLLLPYLFPELSAFATVADLVTHLRTSDARYRATIPADFLLTNQPPMFITLYFIVTRLPDSLCSMRDHFVTLDPTSLTVDLLEQHLLAAETSAVAVGAARGTPRSPFFEGCEKTETRKVGYKHNPRKLYPICATPLQPTQKHKL